MNAGLECRRLHPNVTFQHISKAGSEPSVDLLVQLCLERKHRTVVFPKEPNVRKEEDVIPNVLPEGSGPPVHPAPHPSAPNAPNAPIAPSVR